MTSEGDHPPQTKGWGALGPTLESGRVCLVLVLAASLIKLASGRMVSGGEGGGEPTWAPKPAKQVVLFFCNKGKEWVKGVQAPGPGVIKRPRKAGTFA